MGDTEPTATNRFLRLQTPLGDDKLIIVSFSGVEELSHVPIYYLECLSLHNDLNFDQIIGKNVTIGMECADTDNNAIRYWNGFVSGFALTDAGTRFSRYRMEVVPWLWFLTRTSDCRIFQDKTAAEIITQVFDDFGFKDYAMRARRTLRKREYCTQYRETACNFVMRLLEEEGICFFFQHEDGKHTLVMADFPSDFKPCPLQSKVRMNLGDDPATEDGDAIHEWVFEQLMRSGRYQLNDYSFDKPKTSLQSSATGKVNQGGNQNLEYYDYPGGYSSQSEGMSYVDVRMDEEETPHTVAHGTGRVRSFAAGYSFELGEHGRADQNQKYCLTKVAHGASQGGIWSNDGGRLSEYRNTFSCIPSGTQYRPARLTPKPLISGSQTAFVTGPAGEEIYLDKYGRVKVQFHWDRRGKYDEKSSCWVRVAQIWAGDRWGAVFHPRVGQEVVVDFLEGDPDRPMVTGRVYNADQMPPYSLPDEGTKSSIKTNSSKGGGGFNELRFEDKKGSEQFFLHAEKDMHERVKNDSYETVDKDRHLTIKGDQMESVKGDKHLAVTGDQVEKVNGTFSRTSMTIQEKAQQRYALDSGTEIHLKSGMNLVLESGTTLTLKVGGNFVNINPAGVFIQGSQVLINSGGAAGAGSGSSPDTPRMVTEADHAIPGQLVSMPPPKAPPRPAVFSPQATSLLSAAASGVPFCDT